MKNLSLLYGCVLLLIAAAMPVDRALGQELLANWSYGDNVLNETVSGNAFKPKVGLPMEPVEGPGGKAAYFREGQRLHGNMASPLTPPFTLQITCLPTGHARGAVNGLFQQMSYRSNGFRAGIQRNGHVVFLYEGNHRENFVRTKAQVSLGQWHQIAFVVTTNNASIYIDGKLDVSEKLKSAFIPATSAETNIGLYSGMGGTFNGLIGKVQINKGAVTDFAPQIKLIDAANDPASLAKVLPTPKSVEPQELSPEELKKSLLFAVRFNGDVSATTADGMVDAVDTNLFDLKQGKLVDGVVGQAIDIRAGKCLRYPTPKGLPPADGGSISIWFKTGDWFSDKAAKRYKRASYARRKMLFSSDGVKGAPWRPWQGKILVVGDPSEKRVELSMQLGSRFGLFTNTQLDTDKWHNLVATWGHDKGNPKLARARLYLDSKLVDEQLSDGIPTNAMGEHFNISSTNPGVTYSGLLDEMMILDRPLTEAEILGLYQAVKP